MRNSVSKNFISTCTRAPASGLITGNRYLQRKGAPGTHNDRAQADFLVIENGVVEGSVHAVTGKQLLHDRTVLIDQPLAGVHLGQGGERSGGEEAARLGDQLHTTALRELIVESFAQRLRDVGEGRQLRAAQVRRVARKSAANVEKAELEAIGREEHRELSRKTNGLRPGVGLSAAAADMKAVEAAIQGWESAENTKRQVKLGKRQEVTKRSGNSYVSKV